MKVHSVKSGLLLAGLTVLFIHCFPFYLYGQAASMPEKPTIMAIKVSPPTYPTLAHRAHIAGDVRIQLAIRTDGTIESAEPLTGHPMLIPAALQSARESTFQCLNCTDATTGYSLIYTFEIKQECSDDPDCSGLASHPPAVQQWPGHVAITVDPLCTCDPQGTISRLKWRSAKCLYLWHCSSRVIDEK